MTNVVEEDVKHKFYTDAKDYWDKIPPTIDGMLGGFGHVSPIDIHGSKVFLQQLFKSKKPPGKSYALDCGAGIGRISKHLLLQQFQNVDLVEQNSAFLDKSKIYIGPRQLPKVGSFFTVGLQDFIPEKNKYDIIWIQWVLGHLTDAHLINFFEICKNGLKPNGMIVVKENTTSSGIVEIDEQDSSMTRPLGLLKQLFDKAGLECYRQLKQTSFPKELYNVWMFALYPKISSPNLEALNTSVLDENNEPAIKHEIDFKPSVLETNELSETLELITSDTKNIESSVECDTNVESPSSIEKSQ